MVRRTTRTVGAGVERQAARFLTDNGLHLIDQNFHCRYGEIDLIMLDGEHLVFVEVRFRSERRRVSARFSVDARKRNRIIKTAAMFVSGNPQYSDQIMRFDIVGVDRHRDGAQTLTWIRDAFRPYDSSL